MRDFFSVINVNFTSSSSASNITRWISENSIIGFDRQKYFLSQFFMHTMTSFVAFIESDNWNAGLKKVSHPAGDQQATKPKVLFCVISFCDNLKLDRENARRNFFTSFWMIIWFNSMRKYVNMKRKSYSSYSFLV